MKRALGAAALAIALTACGSASHPAATPPLPTTAQDASPAPTSVATPSPTSVATPPTITKVLTVVEENHGVAAAMQEMPYLASLGRTYGRTTAYTTLTHPSLPNYLAMAGGSTFGVADDAGPSSHLLRGRSVFGEALAAGQTARTYAEAMPSACATASGDTYAARHNPWTYFADAAEREACLRFDVPAGTPTAGALHADIASGSLPSVGLLVPDLCNDAHDCALGTADSWLKGWLPQVLEGPDYLAGHLAVVITFDEDEGDAKGDLLTVVVAPGLHQRESTVGLSHLSWSRWMTDLVGAAPLRDSAAATSLGRAFGL